MKPAQTHKEWTVKTPTLTKIRSWARDSIVLAMSVGKRLDNVSNWIRFPFYHHVLDDERKGFERQLHYLRQFGEFVSLDDAVSLIRNGDVIDGRYFCLSFDDGLESCMSGAAPILIAKNIPAAFFVVTDMIGKTFAYNNFVAKEIFGFRGKNSSLAFMSWDDCKALADSGMIIGSHTQTHVRLSQISIEQQRKEIIDSKLEIEDQIGAPCHHFCAPYGIPGEDFDLLKVGKTAADAGYLSVVTGMRGPTFRGGNPFAIKRDQLMANWGRYQLRYFLSRER